MKAITGIYYKTEQDAIDKAERKEKYEQRKFEVIKIDTGWLVVSKMQADIFDKV